MNQLVYLQQDSEKLTADLVYYKVRFFLLFFDID